MEVKPPRPQPRPPTRPASPELDPVEALEQATRQLRETAQQDLVAAADHLERRGALIRRIREVAGAARFAPEEISRLEAVLAEGEAVAAHLRLVRAQVLSDLLAQNRQQALVRGWTGPRTSRVEIDG